MQAGRKEKGPTYQWESKIFEQVDKVKYLEELVEKWKCSYKKVASGECDVWKSVLEIIIYWHTKIKNSSYGNEILNKA